MKNIKKFQSLKSAFYKYFLRVLGLGAACFLFEACYGTPPVEFNLNQNVMLKGQVKSSNSNLPLKDISINISTPTTEVFSTTNQNGEFNVNINLAQGEEIEILFEDKDKMENGEYVDKTIRLKEGELMLSNGISAYYLDLK